MKDFHGFFYQGWEAGLTKAYLKFFMIGLLFHINRFRHSLRNSFCKSSDEEKMQKLQKTTAGLYSLLPKDDRFSYSILYVIDDPNINHLEHSLKSILNQSVDAFELLIGFKESPTDQARNLILKLEKEYPGKLRYFDHTDVNDLTSSATGRFLVIVGQNDWIRPDFLYRYELTLRIFPQPENIVLYSDFNEISSKNYFIPTKEKSNGKELLFPFVFNFFMEEGLMIPKPLWDKVKGLKTNYQRAEYENLLLELDLAGAQFQHIGLPLYSLREGKKRFKSQATFLLALNKYGEKKKLNWKWQPGYTSQTIRAIPTVQPAHTIQVIIPYKDQRELTLKCVEKLLQQKEVNIKITAVDNRSTDRSIAQKIESLGGEVIFIDEPFNYSRLNNLAVKKNKTAADADLLLFLNNDVELEPDAISEMVRWIDQPQIGMVGCRLMYPNGLLQHGGVSLELNEAKEMHWMHVEKLSTLEQMHITKQLGIFEAVTAACALVKKQDFLKVGCFDEVWYPIGYSDTNLAIKLKNLGLKCFYTPYAVGIHHESISRKSSIEDYENSWWLHTLLKKQNAQMRNHESKI